MSDDAELRSAWREAIGDRPECWAAFDEVIGRHREPGRRYHGVRHVTWVVRHVHALAADPGVHVTDLGAVVAAAFFHDAVYDATRHDNEERSAQLAERSLGALGWSSARCHEVGRLVRATADHATAGDADVDGAVLLDADLAVLGADPAAYQAYVTGVRGGVRPRRRRRMAVRAGGRAQDAAGPHTALRHRTGPVAMGGARRCQHGCGAGCAALISGSGGEDAA